MTGKRRIGFVAIAFVWLAGVESGLAQAQIFGTTDPRQQPRPRTKIASEEVPDEAIREAQADLARERPMGLDAPIDPDTYIIGPYDEFLLFIRGQQTAEVSLRVLPEGTVLVPNAGVLHVAGLTITEFRARLREKLSQYYRNVELHCQLVVPRTFIVYVLGEVAQPGPVLVSAPFRLDMAVDAAGGVNNQGTVRAIEVRMGETLVRTADLQRFRRLGDLEQNPALTEGQTVFVPSRGPMCQVYGEVWHGGSYEVLDDETVADMIELAGGYTMTADRERIVLEHVDDDEETTVLSQSPEAVLSSRVTDRDVVVVPDRRTFRPQPFVRVIGGGGREGRIYLEEGETLASFVPRLMRLRNTHDLSDAVIEREVDGRTLSIPIDFEAVIAGAPVDTLALHDGDVISFPLVSDLVYVTGEVTLPGEVDFQRGLPAGKYIALAGGPTQQGSIDKIEIYDSKGHRRSGNRDTEVFRGETILVKRRTSVIFGNVFFGVISLTSLAVALVAVTQ